MDFCSVIRFPAIGKAVDVKAIAKCLDVTGTGSKEEVCERVAIFLESPMVSVTFLHRHGDLVERCAPSGTQVSNTAKEAKTRDDHV